MEAIKDVIMGNKKKLNVVVAILAVVVGVSLSLIMQQWVFLLTALIVAGYFAMQYFELLQMEQQDALVWVNGVVYSQSEGKSAMGTTTIYRIIPIDATGEFLDGKGKYDIYLEVPNRKKNVERFIVGATYCLAFRDTNGKELSMRTLFAQQRLSAKYDELQKLEDSDTDKAEKADTPDEPKEHTTVDNTIVFPTRKN